MRIFLNSTRELVAAYQRQPGVEPLEFVRTEAYRQFIEAAEQAGFTGADIEMDSEFVERRPEWVTLAILHDLQRWVHTLIRTDRWNGDYPTAIIDACRSGCLSALVERLSGSAGSLHAGR